MRYLLVLFLSLCSQLISYPLTLYSVKNRRRENIPQWIVSLGGGRGVDRALGLPAMGVYHGKGYNFRGVALIEHTRRLLERAPEKVRKELRGRNIKIYSMFWGTHARTAGDKPDNIALHPVVRRWQLPASWSGREDRSDKGFDLKVPVAIFGATPNVRTSGEGNQIPRGKLRAIGVNYHGKDQFSPDNGRIGFPRNDHEVATFWLVAHDPKSKKSIVTFNVVALDDALGIDLVNIIDSVQLYSWEEAFHRLRGEGVNHPEWLNSALGIVTHDFSREEYEAGPDAKGKEAIPEPEAVPIPREEETEMDRAVDEFFMMLTKGDIKNAHRILAFIYEHDENMGASCEERLREFLGEGGEASSSGESSDDVGSQQIDHLVADFYSLVEQGEEHENDAMRILHQLRPLSEDAYQGCKDHIVDQWRQLFNEYIEDGLVDFARQTLSAIEEWGGHWPDGNAALERKARK